MLPARTYSVSIKRDWRELYEQIWRPEFFPKWASGLSDSGLRPGDGAWLADSPGGPIHVRFTERNDHGVMDHFVKPGDGSEIYIPLRIVENGGGSEIMLTLFRQPDMTDEKFSADAKWVIRDLRKLKELAEGRGR
jgi:hypothetical protein